MSHYNGLTYTCEDGHYIYLLTDRKVTSVGEDVEKLEESHTGGGNIAGAATVESRMEVLPKNKPGNTI